LIGFFHDIIDMNRFLRLPRVRLDEFRFRRLQSHIHYCYDNVPYYQNSFRQNHLHPASFKQLSDLQHYPTITKDNVRTSYAAFISKKYRMDKCHKSHTSGSSGQPSWTFFDTSSWIRKKYLSKFRSRISCGLIRGDKIAIFECASSQTTLKYNRNIYALRPIFRIKAFSIFDLIEKTVSDLLRFNPHNFYGTPGYIFQLAQFMDKNRIHLSGLKRIFTSSEFLESKVRHFVERIFGVEIFDIYGSTEFKEIAWECPQHRGYHINEDEVICEILKDGRPAEVGEIGDIVITDLINRAMPLIRYQLKDKGYYLKETCPCGTSFLLMRPVSGRASDYISLPNGDQVSPYLFTTSIEHVNGLLKYQIIQTGKRSIVVKVILGNHLAGESDRSAPAVTRIREILTDVTSGLMDIEIEKCRTIEMEENGKCKVVKNLYTTLH